MVLELLSWREIDFQGAVYAGLIAGYVMTLAGLWAGAVPGLVAFDISDFGRRYMASDRPSAWLFGFFTHHVNSVIFTVFWAMAILPNFQSNFQGAPARPLWVGLGWGVTLAVVLAGALISPMSGLGFLGRRTGNYKFALTNILLHVIWGLIIGAFYRSPT
ncbi:MAG TPA: hypothetical protein DCS07_13955 [Bdellovibrionales bacterium]|nr:MAG: hypothetical protein A2Z97_10295 [Bdellovibrionales bacterium GWB1_52_6]OFZ03335.1 MAG: hypothetical protein A2X97_05170 [Bdellovibrionales bacterium GWA1_52_35]OFZ36340.1 MAG: hypothetical protein A2070_06730 [Bdellovibrionales bacterium GWC1_52_8]HAR43714.1 hypothetical protein [Bdellovibrionales bacterium]HCM40918.1 hypothetical protein [Bdellovibrionales bacterium]